MKESGRLEVANPIVPLRLQQGVDELKLHEPRISSTTSAHPTALKKQKGKPVGLPSHITDYSNISR
jgi:hypothetical protein